MIAGLLVEGLEAVPDERDFLASQDDLFMAAFHQGDGRLRMYLCPGVDQKRRFSGPGGRMRRLRGAATFMSAAFADECTDRPARRARFFELQQNEPLMLGMLVGIMGGPENGPAEAFDGRLLAAMRGA